MGTNVHFPCFTIGVHRAPARSEVSSEEELHNRKHPKQLYQLDDVICRSQPQTRTTRSRGSSLCRLDVPDAAVAGAHKHDHCGASAPRQDIMIMTKESVAAVRRCRQRMRARARCRARKSG